MLDVFDFQELIVQHHTQYRISHHKSSFLLCNGNRSLDAGVKLQVIAFDPVTEDNAVLGHLGQYIERVIPGNLAKGHLRPCCLLGNGSRTSKNMKD
jgi:hypothetical protein